MDDRAKNFKLTIEYDGTHYHGWQVQPNGRSIQKEIESAIETMTRKKIRLSASGRTDAGVHALGQVANFSCDTAITPAGLQKGLNSMLPDDIVIRHAMEVPPQFHARYDATGKLYRYHILNQELPSAIDRRYTWWIRSPLDLAAMEEAGAHIIGEHDFKAFEGTGSPRSHTIRKVVKSRFTRSPEGRITFDIQANGFLRYMVRNIIGTLVDVGRHKKSPGQVKEILDSKDRSLAAATAPPTGLFLVEVYYGEPIG
ncbi:MAG: tRNA pseudouridine(38-40) synthase TruA [Desulfobacteraceae bacterium]|jgi:tRNA pseudouridine38-40 synthase